MIIFNVILPNFILKYMDIREFYRSNQSNNQNLNNNFNQDNDYTYKNTTETKNKDFSDYQDTINKYKDLSQDELMGELLSQATDLKSQGKLNMDMLNQISSTLNPMLNDEQKQLLTNIINKLK